MERQEIERRLAELTQGFFRAKLRLTPRSVEVREEGDALVLRVNGFVAPAERAMIDHPKDRWAIEAYYLRLFDQLTPLLRAGAGNAGPFVKVQTLLDLSSDECRWILTLARQGGVTWANSRS